MDNICLAYCTQLRNQGGGVFILGTDAASRLSTLTRGTVIIGRPIKNCNMWKTHIKAVKALKGVEQSLQNSPLPDTRWKYYF